MPPNILQVQASWLNQWGPKALSAVAAETAGAGAGEYFLPLPVSCLNCGGGDTWGHHLSYKKSNLSQALATFILFLREGYDNNNKSLDNHYKK
ncbi:hypothetical protein TNCV_1583941 [Trichonephila clavipes]|nr:hypothetical protein TNCV_1583941 [Trichonephila clavipes]